MPVVNHTLGHQETRRQMGVATTVTIEAADPITLMETAFAMLARFEAIWSRFIPTSDIVRLNLANGAPTHVDPETVGLVRFMIQANRMTNGAFNPTLLPLQHDSGDDHSLTDAAPSFLPVGSRPWENLDRIVIHDDTTISLPPSMTLDAGGVAKGHAADLVAEAMIVAGATAVSVNIGGDARVISTGANDKSWIFEVHDLAGGAPLSSVSIRNGAIATSSRDARHRGGIGPENHLHHIGSAPMNIQLASVISGEARWAEVLTKRHLFSPEPERAHDQAVLVLSVDGVVTRSDKWKEFEK